MSISNWESSPKKRSKRSKLGPTYHTFKREANDGKGLTSAAFPVVDMGTAVGGIYYVSCFEGAGDSWDVRQARGSPRQRRCPALEEELPVIDDSGSWRASGNSENVEHNDLYYLYCLAYFITLLLSSREQEQHAHGQLLTPPKRQCLLLHHVYAILYISSTVPCAKHIIGERVQLHQVAAALKHKPGLVLHVLVYCSASWLQPVLLQRGLLRN